MTRAIFIAVCLTVLTFGATSCKDTKETIEKGGEAIVKQHDAQEKSRAAVAKTNLTSLQSSINSFYAAEGRYPSDINEVASFAGVELEPGIYNYDPATGQLTAK
ncbi:secreted protein [Candidatus Magnetoovum chiemensis]|nr:secreted protein [Candidatus Magnetoovum chiemensis]